MLSVGVAIDYKFFIKSNMSLQRQSEFTIKEIDISLKA
jgi:hypothetical protein